MKVIETSDWERMSGKVLDLEDVLPELLSGSSGRGTIEQLEADVEAMRRALICFFRHNIKSVEELNAIAGYERFKEVK
jgi:hypothetical protein